jgi:hypothetical protein
VATTKGALVAIFRLAFDNRRRRADEKQAATTVKRKTWLRPELWPFRVRERLFLA